MYDIQDRPSALMSDCRDSHDPKHERGKLYVQDESLTV